MEAFLGTIVMFGCNFAPEDWQSCDGQLIGIMQNQALFSLLGTTYGGDGKSTFALPDMRGRVPMHFGRGPGLSNHELGEKGLGAPAGGDQPHSNMQPYLCVNFIICTTNGIYPTRR